MSTSASFLALATICRWYSANAGSAASLKQTALAAMMCMSGPPCTPGNTVRSRSFAYCSRQSTSPPRGPRSVLCVVVVTKSECGTGLGMDAGRDQAGDVRHVGEDRRADAIRRRRGSGRSR